MELENSANKNEINQENQENNSNNTKEKKSLVTQKKLKVMCKYFMMGKCTKGENCKYLHNEQEKEKRINVPKLECPMFNIGYCKNGNMCNYIHKKCETLPENFSENILPVWIIEHYLEKPINLIFKELEQQNLPEIIELRKKYNLHINAENNNNNNNNNSNLPILIPLKNNNNQNDNNFDKYAPKKNSIENLINSNRLIKYYLVKIDTYNDIITSMEKNTLKINEILKNKLINEISINNNNLTIITIIFDNENLNYTGFAKIKKLSEINKENNDLSLNIEWLWRTKLHYSKLNHLINKSDNDNFFVKGENGCNIDPNLGNYICRLMIKRLSKDEVKELVQEKKIFDNQMISLIENNNYINKINKQINILNDNLKNNKPVKDFFINNINNNSKNKSNNNKDEVSKNMKFEGKKRKRKKSSESLSKSSSLHTYDTHESSNHKKSYDYDYYDKNKNKNKKNFFEKNNKIYHYYNHNDKYNNVKEKFRNKYNHKKYKNKYIN
jgi:hypothetical protein